MVPVKRDGIELALRGADSAANASVLIHNRGSAAKASCSLFLDLLLGEGGLGLLEALGIHASDGAFLLAAGSVIAFHKDVVLVQFYELAPVLSDRHVAVLDEPVKRI